MSASKDEAAVKHYLEYTKAKEQLAASKAKLKGTPLWKVVNDDGTVKKTVRSGSGVKKPKHIKKQKKALAPAAGKSKGSIADAIHALTKQKKKKSKKATTQ